MLNLILISIYFALPAIVSNTVPACVKKLKIFNKPIDGGVKWYGKRVFGSHKTWRGLFFGTLSAIVVIAIQHWFYQYNIFRQISYINYETANIWLIGFLLGFGALLGDAVKSFFKRRVGVRSGGRFFPWDQIDFVIGAGLLVSLVAPLTWQMWLVYIIMSLIFHPLINMFAYRVGLKEVPW